MIFGETNSQRAVVRQALRAWHSWFAWRPVELCDGRGAWLERVDRRGTVDSIGYWVWEYRLPIGRDDD